MGGENGEPPAAAAAEPQERESMLHDSDSETKPRPGRLRWAADTLGLPVRWMIAIAVVALLAVFLLLAVIILAASWPPPPPVDTSVRCETSDCLRAAAQLRSSVAGGDETACDSFWEHTCSVWLRDNPIPDTHSQWGVTEQLMYSAEQRLQRILSTLPQVGSSRSYVWKLDAFYQGCMDRASQPDRSELKNNLVQIINSFHGFDAVGSFEREAWDPRSVVRKLQAEHNIDVFFRVDVVPDLINGANIIQISSGGVGLPERGYYFRSHDDQLRAIYSEFGKTGVTKLCLDTRHKQSLLSLRNKILRYTVVTAYQRYVQDVLLRIGATTDTASRFAENMFNYEKRLVEASLDPLTLRDPTRTPRRVTVDWLRKESPQVDWLHTLQSIYPGAQVNLDTHVLLPDYQYIIELSKIISSTATSSMNAYLMWRLIAGYHPYLVESDRAVLDILRSELTGVKQKPPHWLTCTRMAHEFFPLATGALLSASEPAEVRQRRQVAAAGLFRQLTQSLGGILSYSRFISEQSRASVMQQISSLELVAGYPDLLTEDKLLDSVYSEMNVLRYNFFDSVKAARRHQREVQQKIYLAPGQQWELEPLLNGAEVGFSPSKSTVVVPDYLMRPPLFDPAYPPAFQYGGLGTRMAVAILSSIDPTSLASSASSDNETVHSTMVHNQAAFRACVSAALVSAGLQAPTVTRVARAASLQVLATRLALKALENHVEESGEEQLPGFEELSVQKIFFVAYGQSLCEEKREEKSHWDEYSTFSIDGKHRLDLTVEQSGPFREVFSCNSTQAHVISGPCGGFV